MNNNPHDVLQLRLTKAAMEALLTAQPELKVSLSSAVVNEVAKKHFIKDVENSQQLAAAIQTLHAEADRVVLDRIGDFRRDIWGQTKSLDGLKPDIRKMINEAVELRVSNLLSELVAKAVEEAGDTIADKVKFYTQDAVNKILRERLAKAVKELA